MQTWMITNERADISKAIGYNNSRANIHHVTYTNTAATNHTTYPDYLDVRDVNFWITLFY